RAAPDPHSARHGLRAARAMTLRARLTLVAAGVVAFVVVLASVTTYFVMRHELQAQLDGSLRTEASAVAHHPGAFTEPQDFGTNAARVIGPTGNTLAQSYPVPADRAVHQVARGQRHGFYR